MLTKTERLFLQAVAAAVRDREVSWQGGVAAGEWQELFVLAGRHSCFLWYWKRYITVRHFIP